jgi:uncharacterized damage-inducible protein DinB
MARPLTSVYPDWEQHSNRFRDAVRDLTPDQLAISAGPEHGAIWQLAAHTVGTRVYWLCGVFGEPGAETTPWPDPLNGIGWEDVPDHPRSGEELAWAFDVTWAIVAATLERWTMDDLERTETRRREDGLVQVHTRASVLNRCFTHEAFHAGEVSQLLGVHGIGSIELWSKPWVAADG